MKSKPLAHFVITFLLLTALFPSVLVLVLVVFWWLVAVLVEVIRVQAVVVLVRLRD
jgi:hypothetical protein